MKKYNLTYKEDDKIIEKKNISKNEIDIFLNNLSNRQKNRQESSLRITEVKEIDEEER